MSPEIEDGFRPEAEDLALGAHRALGLRDGRSRLDRREQVLGARRHPANGPPDVAGELRRDDLLTIERSLDAEAAAHVRRDHTELVLRESEDGGEVGAR